ncbi:MAG: hypothetical protein ACT4O5_08765 [Gammaproteobacteria bacterium]
MNMIPHKPLDFLALAATMRLRHFLQTFDPDDEQSIEAGSALYRAALFAIREREGQQS